ncbi:hypothetical protein Tco_0695906, partial [Tanacetum coccineum]
MVAQNQAELGEDSVANEVVHKELGDSLMRAATTASSLEAEQDSGNITKTRSKATPNEAGSQVTTSGGGPRCQKPMGVQLLKLGIDGTMYQFTTKGLDLEKTKTTQQNEIASLKRRVKKFKQKKRSRTHGLKRLHKRRINAIDANEDITLVNVQKDAEMFDVNTLTGDEDKGKVIMVKEPVKTMKKKDLIRLDEEIASKLQAKFDEEERLAREKAEKEANVGLIEEWDDIQTNIKAGLELA